MVPNTKVFVGSLPPSVKPEDLRRLFENFGVVTECDIMNRCGFVHMADQTMAENAIRSLNNTTFKGITISVEPGRMKERGAGKSRNAGGGGGGRGGMRSGSRDNFIRGGPGGPRNNNGGGGGGPARRDSRGGPRSGPYNRNGGNMGNGGGFNQRNTGGNGPFGGNKGGFGGGSDRFDNSAPAIPGLIDNLPGRRYHHLTGGQYGPNYDRRGFLLDRGFSNDNNFNSMGSGRNSGGGGNGGAGFNRGSFGGNQFGSGNDMFNRRDQMGGQRAGGGGNGGFNQDFPPLSGMGGGGGGGMRNGPLQRNMMQNQRF